jgi:hypothetical protein
MPDPSKTPEAAFAAKIDCRFPYADRDLATALIAEGWSLSAEAAFGILHEICQKPRSEAVSRKRQYELVVEWLALGSHPLQQHLLPCAHALIEGSKVPWPDAVSVMDEIAGYNGQYSALNIALFAGDRDHEGDAQLEAAHDRITAAWA